LCQSHRDLNLREISHEAKRTEPHLRLMRPALRRLRLARW